ncbi:MAG: hypothetical protein I8H75_00815 [Myxococcaceae bacterium]|nr:hypothetical protein [Myxococcaceae bacterium]MBH2005883.1 hypothetical protein [Myxococcaceae bacterium]
MRQDLRIQHLLELLKSSAFSSHEEILFALQQRGVQATQATLSRDLMRLGIRKMHGAYRLPAHASAIQIKSAGSNLLVVQTPPGHAPAFAARIDAWALEGLVGTLAGDDAIFIACSDARTQNQIHKALLEQL